jgi:hypothetical protein
LIDFETLWRAKPVRVTLQPDRRRSPDRRALSPRQGVSLLLPAVLLAACGPLPFQGPGPETQVKQPLPKPQGKASKASKAEAQAKAPPLAPLATQQQVVKAVTVGRRDPFAGVLTPNVIVTPETQPKPVSPNVAAPPPPPAVLTWPKGLAFEGVLQTFSESEAMVRYTPSDSKETGPRFGSLRVGDRGTLQGDSLLPPGWQVAAIDGERGVLVLQKGGQSISRQL